MRTETITIYSYSELSEEAKERAYDEWTPYYAFEADNRRTLEAFCDAFGIEVTEYLYDAYHYVFYWDADPEIKEIRKPELDGYIRHRLSLFEPTGFYLDDVILGPAHGEQARRETVPRPSIRRGLRLPSVRAGFINRRTLQRHL